MLDSTSMQYQFDSIAIVHSCFKDKFAIPRQARLVKSATATIELLPPYNDPDIVRGLDDFSHLWLSFIFHQHLAKGWNTMVKPPRLDGKQRFGVLATRASFRPNPIGLSVVEMDFIEYQKSKLLIHVKGADLMDQTPIIDIKPYVPYSDCISDAKGGFTDQVQETPLVVRLSEQAQRDCAKAALKYPHIRDFIEQLLSLDHRAYYYKKIDKVYSSRVYEYDLKWQICASEVYILSLKSY